MVLRTSNLSVEVFRNVLVLLKKPEYISYIRTVFHSMVFTSKYLSIIRASFFLLVAMLHQSQEKFAENLIPGLGIMLITIQT